MRIAILGAAGSIGQSLSLLLKLNLPKNSRLFLYDISPVTPGIAIDLSHIPTSVNVEGFSGNDIDQALQEIDIVIVSAGIARKIGMTRNDLLTFNIDIISDLIKKIIKNSPNSLIGIITNPINITVIIAAEILKKLQVENYKNKLFGITKLDTIRANFFVSQIKKINPEKIHVPVICGHSNCTIVPIFSQTTPKIHFNEADILKVTNFLKNAGDRVLKYKKNHGSATLSMAQAAASFTLSLVKAFKGNNNIIEYAYIEGDGKYARFFSQPILLGKDGIKKILHIGVLNSFEKNLLKISLDNLRSDIKLGEDISSNIKL